MADTPTSEEIQEYTAWLKEQKSQEIACWFIYNYDRDSYGYEEHWKMDLDIAEFRRRFGIWECQDA